jgi:hypothetical protein
MIRLFLVFILLAPFASTTQAGQSNAPLLALWEFDGWAAPTAERPLGLRFLLLQDGSVIYAPDDPAIDRLIPNQYFQARLSSEEMLVLTKALHEAMPLSTPAPSQQGSRTVFYFRDSATGAEWHTELAGHPCLAHGRVFSATAPVAGLKANQNTADRAALPRAIREACNLLTGFHHASTEPWSPRALPAMLPER